jgi:hypothetical protein
MQSLHLRAKDCFDACFSQQCREAQVTKAAHSEAGTFAFLFWRGKYLRWL